jgi:hypothetical protein
MLVVSDSGSVTCFPPTYGMGSCANWDALHHPACLSDPSPSDTRPLYCDEPWCYVDLESCYPASSASVFATDGVVGAATSAFYSYETCGGDSSKWRESLVQDTIKGKTLRVGIPYSTNPEQFMVDPATSLPFPDQVLPPPSSSTEYTMSGIYIDLLTEMQSLGEFDVTYLPVSDASLADHTSSWTACCQDVAAGVLDLCAGGYWITEERIKLNVGFITPITADDFKLLAPKVVTGKTFRERIWVPFSPFTSGVWYSIVGMWLLMGGVYALFDIRKEVYKVNSKDSPVSPGQETRRRSSAGRRSSLNLAITSTDWKLIAFESFSRFVHRTYFAIMEMAAASVTYEGNDKSSRSVGTKLIKAGYALFVVVIVSCYVGNMAAIRGSASTVEAISSVSECAATAGCKLCVHEVISGHFTNKYPSLLTQISSGSGADVVKDLLDGKCSVAVFAGDNVDMNQELFGDSYELTRICDEFTAGEGTEHSVLISMPVSDTYHDALSDLSVQVKSTGLLDDVLFPKYLTTHTELCAESAAPTEEGEDTEAFNTDDFFGLFLITFSLIGIGVLVDVYDYVFKISSYRKEREAFKKKEREERQRTAFANEDYASDESTDSYRDSAASPGSSPMVRPAVTTHLPRTPDGSDDEFAPNTQVDQGYGL